MSDSSAEIKAKQGNKYDNIRIDFEQLHQQLDADPTIASKLDHRLTWCDLALMAGKVYGRLVDAGFIRGWFDEFHEFWSVVLKGRPLMFHDFFYLRGLYRCRFQNVEVDENSSAKEFIQVWQAPATVYSIFDYCYRYALRPASFWAIRAHLPKRNGAILEYGCGVAPITTSMLRYGYRTNSYTIADIRTSTFAFAKYRLRKHSINIVNILPPSIPQFTEKFDTIIIITVLEHLQNPLEVMQHLVKSLKPGGCLIFDYILGGGTGLDTMESVKQRSAVIQFIKANFKLLSALPPDNESIPMTIGYLT